MKKTVLLLLILSLSGIAGKANVSGIVYSEDGETIIGAIVRWENKNMATTTDADGKFELDYDKNCKRLITSFLGYENDTTTVSNPDSPVTITLRLHSLDEVTITTRGRGVVKVSGAENSTLINQLEMFKAACCNLGESFTTNPSVDVTYNDAATGARQIKLLGLSGSYVQMLTENIPAFRGAAQPYSLGYVPGPWMQSIQVSKGASSVKNGYESMTGQINIEYLKPQAEGNSIGANVYGDTEAKVEANVDANLHLNQKLSTAFLAHYEDRYKNHDGNDDGFIDMPHIRQVNLLNRWGYFSSKRITQALISVISEKRTSGVASHGDHHLSPDVYDTDIKTTDINGWLKNAWILNQEKNTNIAFMANYSRHLSDGDYGEQRSLYTGQTNVYSSLMFETEFDSHNSISLGGSIVYDYFHHKLHQTTDLVDRETTPGAYVQYTYKLADKFVAMAGLRYDHSSIYGSFVTPRAHIKWAPVKQLTIRASAGKGYRTVNPWAEYNYLLSSSLPIKINENLAQEEAYNYGISSTFSTSLFNRPFSISGEYYFTDFKNQVILDRDSNPGEINITNLNGKSYSHTLQFDLNYEVFDGFTFAAAYRYNDVKETYNGIKRTKPLTSRYKGLLSLSYLTPLELWQFDLTLQLNGGGRLPSSPVINNTKIYSENYSAFAQLSGQVTRHFRHISVYIGGENLTNYKQKNPIINIQSANYYDPTLVWGPISGAMVYAGFRLKFNYK